MPGVVTPQDIGVNTLSWPLHTLMPGASVPEDGRMKTLVAFTFSARELSVVSRLVVCVGVCCLCCWT